MPHDEGYLCSYFRDFDDAPATDGQPSGLAATQVLSQTPAAASLLAGTSSNPLDDLVSIFGSSTMSTPTAPPTFGGLGGADMFGSSPVVASPPQQPRPPQNQQPQDDLLGLF